MSGIYFSNSGLSMVNISSRYREVSLNMSMYVQRFVLDNGSKSQNALIK